MLSFTDELDEAKTRVVTQKESKAEDIVGQGCEVEKVINNVTCFRWSDKIK